MCVQGIRKVVGHLRVRANKAPTRKEASTRFDSAQSRLLSSLHSLWLFALNLALFSVIVDVVAVVAVVVVVAVVFVSVFLLTLQTSMKYTIK